MWSALLQSPGVGRSSGGLDGNGWLEVAVSTAVSSTRKVRTTSFSRMLYVYYRGMNCITFVVGGLSEKFSALFLNVVYLIKSVLIADTRQQQSK